MHSIRRPSGRCSRRCAKRSWATSPPRGKRPMRHSRFPAAATCASTPRSHSRESAMCDRAMQMAAAIEKDHPKATLAQQYWLPAIRAAKALHDKDWDAAIALLEPTAAVELGARRGDLHRPHVSALPSRRGLLRCRAVRRSAGRIPEARGPSGPRAQLHPRAARAPGNRALVDRAGQEGRSARVPTTRFLTLWKTADPDLAVLGAAKAGS